MDKIISAAKNAKKEIYNDPLSVIFENPNENVEFAAWHRIAYIKCNQTISSYEDFLKNVTLESINILKKNETKKEKIFKESKFIDINNNANELFGKIVDDLKNENAIKVKSNLNNNKLDKHKFIIDYDNIDFEAIKKGVTETDNDIIDDSTIDNIKNIKNTIEWFKFSERYKDDFNTFNEDYGCNINDSANVDDQDKNQDKNIRSGGSGLHLRGYNKYLKNIKKSKRKKNKVKKGGFGPSSPYAANQPSPQPRMMPQPQPMPQPMPMPPLSPSQRLLMPQPGMIQGAPGMPIMMPAPGMPIMMPAPGMMMHEPWIPYQNSQPQNQTKKNYETGIEKHTEAILIIKKKKRIEFYKPINITKVKRLTYIVKSKSDRDRKKEKEESKERLENDFSKLTPTQRGYLAQFGGNFELKDIKDAILYTPIPLFSVRTVKVRYGLWNLESDQDDPQSYTVIDDTNYQGLESLIRHLQNIISQAKNDPEKLANQLDLTKFEGMKYLEESANSGTIEEKIKYKFTIGGKNYCYKSSIVRVYLVKTSSEFIQEENKTELNNFRKFQNNIDKKIEDLKQREEKILQEATNNVSSNINRSDEIEEKDNERVDKILMNLATFLAYAMKELGKYLFKVITLLLYLFIEVWRALRDYIAIIFTGLSKQWSNVAAGAIILIILFLIIFGITLGIKNSKPKNVKTIKDSDNANKKTLYSIILAIPSDISNAYNSFIKFTNSVNTMLFDAKKSFDDITTEMVYSEDSKLLEERIMLPNEITQNGDAENIKKRIDYIMHFTTNGKDVNHVYNPKSNVPLTLGSNTQIGEVAITKPTGNNTKYTATCSTTSDDSEYIDTNCKIKLIDATDCIGANSIPQESVQQAKKIKFENDYDHIIVST